MKTLTFKSNGAVIEVREEIGRDVFTRPAILNMLVTHYKASLGVEELSDALWSMIIGYARIVSRTVKVEGHIPFDLPSPNASNEALIAGFEAVMSAPVELIRKWESSLEAVNHTPMETQEQGKSTGE